MHIHGQQISGRSNVFRQDHDYNSLVVVDAFHHMVHEGRAFIASDYDADTDIVGPKLYRIVAPAAPAEIHFEFDFYASAAGLLELFEAPTITGNGSALTARNLNRNSAISANLVIAGDATISGAGTLLWQSRLGAGQIPVNSVGGNASARHELILKYGTIYLLRFTTDADNNKTWMNYYWYEL